MSRAPLRRPRPSANINGAIVAIPELETPSRRPYQIPRVVDFYNVYRNLPDKTIVLLRGDDVEALPTAAIVPVGKGRLILLGTAIDPTDLAGPSPYSSSSTDSRPTRNEKPVLRLVRRKNPRRGGEEAAAGVAGESGKGSVVPGDQLVVTQDTQTYLRPPDTVDVRFTPRRGKPLSGSPAPRDISVPGNAKPRMYRRGLGRDDPQTASP